MKQAAVLSIIVDPEPDVTARTTRKYRQAAPGDDGLLCAPAIKNIKQKSGSREII